MLMAHHEPDEALWAAALTPDDGVTRDSAGRPEATSPRDMPEVRIEPHRTVSLDQIPDAPTPVYGAGARYHVVRFDFSLRPKPNRVQIEWVRLRVEMLPGETGEHAWAEDLHPSLVERTVARHVNLGVAPSLKFQQLEVSAGNYTRSYDYESIEPLVSAAGVGGHDLSWDFTATPDSTLSGGRRMHALVAVPAAMSQVRARLSFAADLRVERRLLPAHLETREGPTLDVLLIDKP